MSQCSDGPHRAGSRAHGTVRGVAVLLGAVLLLALTACEREPAEPLRVGLVVWPPYEMAYLAQDLGYFDGANIELVDFGSPADFVIAYRAGSVDSVATVFDYLLQMEEFAPGQRIVMAIDVSLGGDALVARPEVTTLADLRGRRIGYEASALGAYMLTRALAAAGLSRGDIVPHPVDTLDHLQAFREGVVDAVVTYEPTVSLLQDDGAHVLFDSARIPGEIVDVLMTSEATLQNKRAQLQRLVDGWMKAVRYTARDPQDAARRVAAREQMSPEAFLATFDKLRLMGLDDNREYLMGDAAPVHAALARHRDVMLEEGFLGQRVDTRALVDPSLVLDARDE